MTLILVGTQSLTARDNADSTITGTLSGIIVNPILAVSGVPSPINANTPGDITVTAQDIQGRLDANYRGTVHFTSSDGAATFPADYAFQSGDAGTHTFAGGVRLATGGLQSITATDTLTPSITGTQTGITVNAGGVTALLVGGFPSPTSAGTAGNFTVTAKDSGGGTVADYTGTVHFTSSDGAATLPANYTFVSGDAGSHTFSATLNTAGTQSITATDTANAGLTGTQAGISVLAASGPPVITSPLTAAGTVGQPFTYQITATNSPTSFNASGLPAGLSVNTTTGFISGTPTTAGVVTVNISATNPIGPGSAALVLTTTFKSDIDTDGDGFPDEIEIALGSNPNDPNSTPFGGSPAPAPQPPPVPLKLAIKLNFAKVGTSDSITLSGALPVPANFIVLGQTVTLDVGGVVKTFTLNAKGTSPKSTTDTFKLTVKAKKGVVAAQTAKFSLKSSKGNFALLLTDEGLTNANATKKIVTVPVLILFNLQFFEDHLTQLYSAKFNKTGMSK